jgi:hypothetical protein
MKNKRLEALKQNRMIANVMKNRTWLAMGEVKRLIGKTGKVFITNADGTQYLKYCEVTSHDFMRLKIMMKKNPNLLATAQTLIKAQQKRFGYVEVHPVD